MAAYIARTGAFLPGFPIENHDIQQYLGRLEGEEDVERQVLNMNGIVRRYYAQSLAQMATHDVYDLACRAIENCLESEPLQDRITYLSAGTTYAPLAGPGLASIVHHRLAKTWLDHSLELSSQAGICTSAAAAIVSAVRAVNAGDHQAALCVGTEHASEILKSSVIQPIDDRNGAADLRRTQWFMSAFLRFMLSDGAGAFLIQSVPAPNRLNWRVDWTHSMSFAHAAPLCMQLQSRQALLMQDVSILSRHLFPTGFEFAKTALTAHGERLDNYDYVLPHLSSFFFRRKVERILAELSSDPQKPPPYWTNLATAGNTGSASIYILLDEFLRTHDLRDGQRLLLFIPESGQFNFVMVSLTAVSA